MLTLTRRTDEQIASRLFKFQSFVISNTQQDSGACREIGYTGKGVVIILQRVKRQYLAQEISALQNTKKQCLMTTPSFSESSRILSKFIYFCSVSNFPTSRSFWMKYIHIKIGRVQILYFCCMLQQFRMKHLVNPLPLQGWTMNFVYIGKEVTLYVVPATLHVMLIKGNLSRCCQLPLNPISVELAGCSSSKASKSLWGVWNSFSSTAASC